MLKKSKKNSDLKYDSYNWVSEWLKADQEKDMKTEIGIQNKQNYILTPKILISELAPGRTTREDIERHPVQITGALSLESDVLAKGSEGIPVLMRVTWQNVNGHVFDEIHSYRLIGTKIVSSNKFGYSFTFRPEGIISKKDTGKL
ncbi:MAG: hypothetical protein V1933_03225 [Candidatus Omnitrophota bacterium]